MTDQAMPDHGQPGDPARIDRTRLKGVQGKRRRITGAIIHNFRVFIPDQSMTDIPGMIRRASPADAGTANRPSTMPPRLVYLVTEDWYFISHRLPMARAAQAAGFEVHVITRVNRHGDAITAAGFHLHPVHWRRGSFDPRDLVRTVREIRGRYRELAPDIAHHVALLPTIAGSLAALRPPDRLSQRHHRAGHDLHHQFDQGARHPHAADGGVAPAARARARGGAGAEFGRPPRHRAPRHRRGAHHADPRLRRRRRSVHADARAGGRAHHRIRRPAVAGQGHPNPGRRARAPAAARTQDQAADRRRAGSG